MGSFDGVQRGNYFEGESIRRTEKEVIVGNLRNRKAVARMSLLKRY